MLSVLALTLLLVIILPASFYFLGAKEFYLTYGPWITMSILAIWLIADVTRRKSSDD